MIYGKATCHIQKNNIFRKGFSGGCSGGSKSSSSSSSASRKSGGGNEANFTDNNWA